MMAEISTYYLCLIWGSLRHGQTRFIQYRSAADRIRQRLMIMGIVLPPDRAVALCSGGTPQGVKARANITDNNGHQAWAISQPSTSDGVIEKRLLVDSIQMATSFVGLYHEPERPR